MSDGGVALVRGEPILRPQCIEDTHGFVARRLGQDGSRRDGGLGGVALDDGKRGIRQRGAAVAVDQDLSRRLSQAEHPVFATLP